MTQSEQLRVLWNSQKGVTLREISKKLSILCKERVTGQTKQGDHNQVETN